MKNILILTSGHCKKASANGMCSLALAEELKKHNVGVYVVSCDKELSADDTDNTVVSVLRQPKKVVLPTRNLFLKLYRRIRNILFHTWTPEYETQTVERLVDAGNRICSNVRIDGIICMYFPLETIIAGKQLKERYPQISLMVYELDSVKDGISGSSKRNGHFLFSWRNFLSRLYRKADCVMVLKCHEHSWLQEFPQHKHRLQIVDLPLITPPNLPLVERQDNQLQLLYAGELSEDYRSPAPLLEAFRKLDIPAHLHFFSRGCENALERAMLSDDRIICHGYVEKAVLDRAVAQADILLSIGNQVSNSLPSKGITYMTYGKPIIHFSLQKNDICETYFRKYPLALIIEQGTNADEAAKMIEAFVQDCSKRTVPFEQLQKAFPMNMPSYSAQVILEGLQR